MSEVEYFEEREMDKTTLEEFERLCAVAFEQRARIDEIKEKVKEEEKVLEGLEQKIATILDAHEKQSYQSAYGTVYFHETKSFKLPEGAENKQLFYNYLKQKGIFEDIVSVHSKTLNGFCAKEMEAALEQGNVTFKVPGINDPVVIRDVRFKKARGK